MAVDALAQSERILTLIFTELFRQNQNQDLQRSLLAECGRTVHRATANVLFRTLVLPDDDAQFGTPETGPASAVVRNGRYAPYVQTLIILDPLAKQEPTLFELDDEPDPIRPIPGSRIQSLLAQCTSLEELIWAASVPPPDGICETLSTHSPNLKRFTFAPASNPSIPKWDARSLSLLPPLNYLHLTRLSQAGASALASHPPDVHHLVVDFVWLDDWVCERLARMSRVKRLTVGTGGTKLTDRGVSALVEGLDALEVLELVEVQGRLSKTLWENVELPLSLRTFKVVLSESGPHHSWTADHLLSFPSLQGLDQLERISIARTYSGGQIDDVAVAKPVPSDVVEALKGCTRVKHLECDWWAWSTDDLKELIGGCSNLETLRITLDAPFARLLSLTSSFAHMAHLSHLYVTVPVSHAPSTPPSPTLPTPSMSPLRVHGIMIGSPTSSPISLARSFKSPKLVMSALPDEGSPTTSPITPGGAGNMNDTIEVVDCMLPPLRDVRKFMRRCPKLVVLEWFGRTARGAWVAHREDAKSVAGIKVEYVGPGEEELAGATGVDHPWRVLMDTVGLVPRDESEWTGPEAEVAANAVREYEAERDGEIEREKEARRRRPSVSKRRATVSVVHEVSKPRRRQSSAEVKAKATRARG